MVDPRIKHRTVTAITKFFTDSAPKARNTAAPSATSYRPNCVCDGLLFEAQTTGSVRWRTTGVDGLAEHVRSISISSLCGFGGEDRWD
jgi:hypothetical protein